MQLRDCYVRNSADLDIGSFKPEMLEIVPCNPNIVDEP